MQEAFRLRGLTLEEPALMAASAGRDPDNKLIPTGKNAAGLVSREELKEVVGFAKDKARATLAAMLEGRAELSPARQGGALSCKSCGFGGVCGFDPELGCRARNLKRMNKAAFFQALDPKEEENELDG